MVWVIFLNEEKFLKPQREERISYELRAPASQPKVASKDIVIMEERVKWRAAGVWCDCCRSVLLGGAKMMLRRSFYFLIKENLTAVLLTVRKRKSKLTDFVV